MRVYSAGGIRLDLYAMGGWCSQCGEPISLGDDEAYEGMCEDCWAAAEVAEMTGTWVFDAMDS